MLNWKARGSWSVSALGFRLNAIACDGTLPTRAPAICSLKLSSSAGSPLAIEGGPTYALTLVFARLHASASIHNRPRAAQERSA